MISNIDLSNNFLSIGNLISIVIITIIILVVVVVVVFFFCEIVHYYYKLFNKTVERMNYSTTTAQHS